MSKDFEYVAMQALAKAAAIFSGQITPDNMSKSSLSVREYGEGLSVMYPKDTPRKNPACIVVVERGTHWSGLGWRFMQIAGTKGLYVYEAGKFDLARGCEKASSK